MSRLARFRNRRLRRGTGKYEVVEDGYDVRLPLHNDDIFQHGISFAVKLIGSMEVPRPSSRLEIITSMRQIRHEFKMKGMKKKRVHIYISQNGVKTSERIPTKRRSRFVRRTPKQQLQQATGTVLMEHTIFKVFYVSHDSKDLKIFSYIARDGPDNTFKCYVFKAKKRSQALNVVRTMGQAFEVVHKLQKQKESNTKEKESAIESEKTPAVDPNSVDPNTTVESPGGEDEGNVPVSPDNLSVGSDKARTADEGLGGSETFPENEPVGSPIPSAFSISEPQATSSPEPSQALAQQNQTMQKMITMLRKQLESEMHSKSDMVRKNDLLAKQNNELLLQCKQMKEELAGLKVGTISKIIGNTQHPGMPIFVSTPGSPPTPPNTNDSNNVSILDLPVPPVEETLIPIPTRQNWEIFDDKE